MKNVPQGPFCIVFGYSDIVTESYETHFYFTEGFLLELCDVENEKRLKYDTIFTNVNVI